MFGPFVMGIDMGTTNTRISAGDKGVVADGSSVVAVDARDGEIVAFGDRAKMMLGRTPEHIAAYRPVRDGAITDFDLVVSMLKGFMQDAKRKTRRFGRTKPNVVLCVPADVTPVERKAVEQAAAAAGAHRVVVIESILAAAIGAGLPVWEPTGSAVVSIGGGKTEAAVVSLGGLASGVTVKAAGDAMDDSIRTYLKRKYNVVVGSHTAEQLKIGIGSAVAPEFTAAMRVAGMDSATGLPKWVDVSSDDLYEALYAPLGQIVWALKRMLDECPPQLASDLPVNGVVLTGGGALLDGMDTLITRETGLPARTADHPLHSAALGCRHAADTLRLFRTEGKRLVTEQTIFGS